MRLSQHKGVSGYEAREEGIEAASLEAGRGGRGHRRKGIQRGEERTRHNGVVAGAARDRFHEAGCGGEFTATPRAFCAVTNRPVVGTRNNGDNDTGGSSHETHPSDVEAASAENGSGAAGEGKALEGAQRRNGRHGLGGLSNVSKTHWGAIAHATAPQ